MSHSTRRQFLKTSALVTAGAPFILKSVFASTGRIAPSDRITIGMIGFGRMARRHANSFTNQPDTQVVAISDVADIRMEEGARQVNEFYAENSDTGNYNGCSMHGDFREIIDRDDIDAVIISTPDHWHAIPSIMAANAGKHVYCEKPLCHTIREGRAVSEAVNRNGIKFQTGSQQRSEYEGRFRRAVELVRNGRIGKLHSIHVGVGSSPVLCDLPAEQLPEGIDWDRWLGPAPWRPFNQILCPTDVHDHFPNWRLYSEYAGGIMSDWGTHHYDIAQWALDMDRSGPVEIHPPAFGLKGGLMFRYANGVKMYHGNDRNAVTFHGSEGEITVARGFLEATPESILEETPGAGELRLYDPNQVSHKRNWLDCIKNGGRTVADAETGHRTNTICALANIGYLLQRSLEWDPKAEQFVDDTEANRYLDKIYRRPWTLEAAINGG